MNSGTQPMVHQLNWRLMIIKWSSSFNDSNKASITSGSPNWRLRNHHIVQLMIVCDGWSLGKSRHLRRGARIFLSQVCLISSANNNNCVGHYLLTLIYWSIPDKWHTHTSMCEHWRTVHPWWHAYMHTQTYIHAHVRASIPHEHTSYRNTHTHTSKARWMSIAFSIKYRC